MGSRSRCSRPERGQPKVPFSACRCHILVIDYRWGSMGSDETAITIPGGPRVIDVFYGDGRHRVQIIYFLWMQIGSRTPSGIGLESGGRLRRMRGRFHRWIHISTGPQPDIGLEHKSDNFSIQRPLGSPKRWRMRPRGPPDLRPIPEGVREPIYIRKK